MFAGQLKTGTTVSFSLTVNEQLESWRPHR
jgi:hypothetical protein